MNYSPNIKQVETVLKYIKEQLYSGRLQPGERLPAERRLAEKLGVGRAHVRAAFQKLEFYGIVQTFPQSGTVVAQEKMQVLERMITDALQIEQYDFASLVYVRELLEIEAVKLCARNRTVEDLAVIEAALKELPEAEVAAIGTNAIATSNMLKSGVKEAATGEYPVVLNAPKADFILGPVGIIAAGSLMGEVTPEMARAVGLSGAKKVLVPMNRCETLIAGMPDTPVGELVKSAVEMVKREVKR